MGQWLTKITQTIWRIGIRFLTIYLIFYASMCDVNAYGLYNLSNSPMRPQKLARFQEFPVQPAQNVISAQAGFFVGDARKTSHPPVTANPIITPTPPRTVTPDPAPTEIATPIETATSIAMSTQTPVPTILATITPFVIPIGAQKDILKYSLYLPISYE